MQMLLWGLTVLAVNALMLTFLAVPWSWAGQKRAPVSKSETQEPARQLPVPVWDEPTEFRGLTFGEDLRQRIAECPSSYTAGMKFYNWTKTKERCWEPMYASRGREADYHLRNFPPLGRVPSGRLWARQIDDHLSFVSLTVDHDFSSELEALLIERYSKPTAAQVVEVKTKAGATFTSRELQWKGVRMGVEFSERSNRVDESLLGIFTQEWVAYEAQKRAEQRQQGVRGLGR